MNILGIFTSWDIAVLAGYFGLMVFVGWWSSRRKSDAEGYFLAERSMPMWLIALSVVATSLSVATFQGAPQQSYDGDLTYLSSNIGTFLAAMIVATVFVPRFYRSGAVTIYGVIDQRFGEESRLAVSGMFLLGRLIASGVRLFFAAIPVCMLLFSGTDDPTSTGRIILAIVLIGGIGVAYTIAGGIRAVIWTDTFQILIILGTLFLSIGLLYHHIPMGAGEIMDLLKSTPGPNGGSKLQLIDLSWDIKHPFTLWTSLIGATFLMSAAYGVDHDLAQRVLTAKSPVRGGISLMISQFVGVFIVSLFMIVGLLLYIYYKRPDVMGAAAPTDIPPAGSKIFVHFLLNHLPVGLTGLAMAGMFAIAQGSLDSAINAMASSVIADIYWPLKKIKGEKNTRASRLAVAGIGGVLILFAIGASLVYNDKNTKLLNFALDVMSFAYSGMLAVFLTALMTRRGNKISVMMALLTGMAATAVMWDGVWDKIAGFQMAGFWRMPIATILALLVCVSGRGRVGLGEMKPGSEHEREKRV